MIGRMRIACSITKATNIPSEYVIFFLLFHCNNGYANAPQYYVIRTLPVLLCLFMVSFILQNNELERMSGSGRGLL